MSRNTIIVLIYHCQKLSDLILKKSSVFIFSLEDGGSVLLQNTDFQLQNYTVPDNTEDHTI
jgi:hypothetical protein